MCQNLTNLYFRFAIATLAATVLGIVAGIIWPAFFTSFPTLLLIELITAAVTLVILAVYLLARGNRNSGSPSYARYYIRYLLFGALGAFVISIIALSTVLTQGLSGSIIFGTAIGFFVLLILGIYFLLDFSIKNSFQSRE